MIIEILFIMTMFLWFLSAIPHPAITPFAQLGGNYLNFVAVLLLGLYLFALALRG